jgi:hypothetical protein
MDFFDLGIVETMVYTPERDAESELVVIELQSGRKKSSPRATARRSSA